MLELIVHSTGSVRPDRKTIAADDFLIFDFHFLKFENTYKDLFLSFEIHIFFSFLLLPVIF